MISRYGKGIVIVIAIMLFLSKGIYDWFFRVTNEIGAIGTDKIGRQVMLQTFNSLFPNDTRFDSEWNDATFIRRLLIQEPMRTTMRIFIPPTEPCPTTQDCSTLLKQPYSVLLSMYTGEISMNEGSSQPLEEVEKRLKKSGATTVEDCLSAFGFKHLEYYCGKNPIAQFDLKMIQGENTIVIGDGFRITVGASYSQIEDAR